MDATTATSSSRPTATRACRARSTGRTSTAKYHEAFDDYLAERHAIRDAAHGRQRRRTSRTGKRRTPKGLRGAYDPAQRDKELDGDGVAGEVLFPDADAITGGASPPFGAGLSAADIADPELAFAGRACPQPVPRRAVRAQPRTPRRRRARADHARRRPRGRRDRVGRGQRAARRDPRADDVARTTRRTSTRCTSRCGPRARRTTCRCTRTPARRRRTSTRRTSACTSPRSCGGRCGRCGSCCSAARSSGTRT